MGKKKKPDAEEWEKFGSSLPPGLWDRLGELAANWRPRTSKQALLAIAVEEFLGKHGKPRTANAGNDGH